MIMQTPVDNIQWFLLVVKKNGYTRSWYPTLVLNFC